VTAGEDCDYVGVSGQRLECRRIGDGGVDGLGLLLLHEGLGSLSQWRDFPMRLAAAAEHPVFVWSRAGYGRSSAVPLPWPLTYMHDEARDILPGVIAAAGFRRPVLVGHSDGASIAAIYAGSAASPNLAGLVLMAPHFFVEDVSVDSIAKARRAYETGDLRERLMRHHGANVDAAFRGWNGAWLDPEFRHWNISEFLPRIRVPVLLVQGAEDEYGTLAQLDTAERLIAGPVKRLVLEKCGHAPHRDQPEQALAAIAGFVAGLGA
jgi:pimeloyl-ACP methyl ester carboxylesterase